MQFYYLRNILHRLKIIITYIVLIIIALAWKIGHFGNILKTLHMKYNHILVFVCLFVRNVSVAFVWPLKIFLAFFYFF